MMLSIFSSTCWSSVCLLEENVYSVPLPIFQSDFFFAIELYEYILWILTPYMICKCFLSFSRLSFNFVDVPFAVQNLFSLM